MATKKITKKKTTVKKAAPKKAAAKTKKATVLKSRHIIPYHKGEMMKSAYMQAIKTPGAGIIKFNNGREFDKSLFEILLKVKGVEKIRIYNALNDKNEHTFVITAVNKQKFSLVIPVNTGKMTRGAGEGSVGNMGDQCTDPKYKS